MTDTQITLIVGFGSTTVATIAGIVTNWIATHSAAKKADQALQLRAIEIQEQNLALAKAAEQRINESHADISRTLQKQNVEMVKQGIELRENTRLTEVGNDIKSDIRINQAAIVELKQAVAPSPQLDRIESTSVDTNATVHEIKEAR